MQIKQDELQEYLEKRLKLPLIKLLSLKSEVEQVKCLVRSYLTHIPFHNLGMLKQNKLEFATEQEILLAGLAGRPLMCAGNVFLKCILGALGFDAYVILCNFSTSEVPVGYHLAAAVELNQTTIFIDIASGLPLATPIDMKNLPKTIKLGDSTLEFRQANNDLSRIEFCEVGGNIFTGKFAGRLKEKMRYNFTLTPVDYDKDVGPRIESFMDLYRYLPEARTPFIFRFVRCITTEDFKFIGLWGKCLAIVTPKFTKVQSFSSKKDVLEMIHNFFPMISLDELLELEI